MRFSLIAFACAALTLSACADTRADYPSLAIRDVELVKADPEEIEPVSPPASPGPDQLQRAQTLLSEAQALHRRFQAQLPQAQRAALRASGSVATPSKADALVMLGVLDGLHGEVLGVFAELDVLLAEIAIADLDQTEIARQHLAVSSLVESEASQIRELERRLGT